jgi:hypothetical protein
VVISPDRRPGLVECRRAFGETGNEAGGDDHQPRRIDRLYDLLNEPISPYSDENYLNPRLETSYRQIVAAIRSVDLNHLALFAGAQWGTNFAMFDRPFDANAVRPSMSASAAAFPESMPWPTPS